MSEELLNCLNVYKFNLEFGLETAHVTGLTALLVSGLGDVLGGVGAGGLAGMVLLLRGLLGPLLSAESLHSAGLVELPLEGVIQLSPHNIRLVVVHSELLLDTVGHGL